MVCGSMKTSWWRGCWSSPIRGVSVDLSWLYDCARWVGSESRAPHALVQPTTLPAVLSAHGTLPWTLDLIEAASTSDEDDQSTTSSE